MTAAKKPTHAKQAAETAYFCDGISEGEFSKEALDIRSKPILLAVTTHANGDRTLDLLGTTSIRLKKGHVESLIDLLQ